MWSRIKKWVPIKRMPVSVKLTLFYASILFCILLLLSVLTVGGMYLTLMKQAGGDIDQSVSQVKAYLAGGKPISTDMLKQNLLAQGVSLRIYDAQKQVVLDSEPYDREDEFLRQDRKHRIPFWQNAHGRGDVSPGWGEQDFYGNEHELIKRTVWSRGSSTYYLEFRRDLTDTNAFLDILTASLAVINLLGLLIAIIAGYYLSRKILQPLRDITYAAREIEINQLDRRIPVPASEDELKELSVTFNHMLDRIQSGFEWQSRFISDASHELRTPVTVIAGYADMLDRWAKEEPSALAEGIEAIKSEAGNMQDLIENLLFLARADKGRQELRGANFNLAGLIDEVVRDTSLIAPNHQVILERNDEAEIWGDVALIKQMLRIFLDNSIKFTPPGGSIRISSGLDRSGVEIVINDSGIGIPAAELPRVWDRFYRVDKSRTKTTGGTGLGMSIAQWIAEQHHCEIQISSKEGEGTAVRIRFPQNPAAV